MSSQNISFGLTYAAPLGRDQPLTRAILYSFLCGLPATSAVAVAQEHHQDGSLHYHAFWQRNARTRLDIATFFNCEGIHPNVKSIKAPKKWLEYLGKEDTEPLLLNCVLPKPKIQKFSKFAELIRSGKSILELDEVDPGFVLQHRKKLDDYIAFHSLLRQRALTTSWQPLDESLFSGTVLAVAQWLNDSVLTTSRQIRTKNLMIIGTPGIGKTRLSSQLQERLRCFLMPMTPWFNHWDDQAYDLGIWDEPSGLFPIQMLLRLFDGQVMDLPNKTLTPLWKRKNIPWIVFSNHPWTTIFANALERNPTAVDALEDRFHILNLTRPFNLFPMTQPEPAELSVM